jgi:D-inositol-3-phosphate glycosyltransferase
VVDVNPDAISSALIEFYDNDLEAEFTANVKEEKKKYSWSNMATQIINTL